MIDFVILMLVIVSAYGYRKITEAGANKQRELNPQKTTGDDSHSKMPEMEYIPGVEISEQNASNFLNAGRRHMQGVYAVRDENGVST